MAGPYHLDNGIPCQDSFCVKKDDHGVVFASVADGLGSESHSDEGSRIASRRSCEYCMEHYVSGMPYSEVKKIMNNAFVNAYRAVLEEAQAAGNSSDEYDTTLSLAIYDNGHVFYGQSGDSGILALMKSGEYVPLTIQQRDEDGYVFPLCSGPDKWIFGEVEGTVSSIMLMTDGVWEQICPPLLHNHKIKVNVPLAGRFMDRRERSLRHIKKLEEAAGRYLENYPRRFLDDDKTIVVVYDPLQPAKRMPEEYYKVPDWASLQERAMAKLYTEDFDEQTQEAAKGKTSEQPDGKVYLCGTGPEPEGMPDTRDCGLHMDSVKNEFTNTENHFNNTDTGPAPAVSASYTQAIKRHTPGIHAGYKPGTENNDRNNSADRKYRIEEKRYGLVAVMIIAAFSIAAFAISGFVKEHTPVTCLGVFLVCFIANSAILLPAPSALVVIQYSMTLDPVAVAISGALGAALGEMVGFMAGECGHYCVNGKIIRKIEEHMPRHPYLFIFAFSALPLPLFDVAGVMAGAIGLNKYKFYIACFAGKLLKMLVLVWIGQVVADCFR